MDTVFLTVDFLSGYCNGDYRNMSGDQPQRVQSLLCPSGRTTVTDLNDLRLIDLLAFSD